MSGDHGVYIRIDPPERQDTSLGSLNSSQLIRDAESGPSSFNSRQEEYSQESHSQWKRIVSKAGEPNIKLFKISHYKRLLIQDLFTTCLEMKWRWTLVLFVISFVVSWVTFASIWYLICYVHGDFEPEHLPELQEKNGWTPCVYMMKNFLSALLFSIEAQHTIGFGQRSTSEECSSAIILESVQSLVGVLIQAFMAGLVFAKLTRPKKRSQTVAFSRNAVIHQRDGSLCLVFRVANLRSSKLLGTRIRAVLIHKVRTLEGDVFHHEPEELQIGTSPKNDGGNLFLLWPVTVTHRIDETSPLYSLQPRDLMEDKFEIVTILDGVIEPTGNAVQACSSYLASEILWGYTFQDMISYVHDKGEYAVDFSVLDHVLVSREPVPRTSARQVDLFRSSTRQSLLSTSGDGVCHSTRANEGEAENFLKVSNGTGRSSAGHGRATSRVGQLTLNNFKDNPENYRSALDLENSVGDFNEVSYLDNDDEGRSTPSVSFQSCSYSSKCSMCLNVSKKLCDDCAIPNLSFSYPHNKSTPNGSPNAVQEARPPSGFSEARSFSPIQCGNHQCSSSPPCQSETNSSPSQCSQGQCPSPKHGSSHNSPSRQPRSGQPPACCDGQLVPSPQHAGGQRLSIVSDAQRIAVCHHDEEQQPARAKCGKRQHASASHSSCSCDGQGVTADGSIKPVQHGADVFFGTEVKEHCKENVAFPFP